MYRRQFSVGWSSALVIVAILTWASGAQAASKYKLVFDFGKHGYRPHGNLAFDPNGNLYTAMQTCCGPQFDELTDTRSGWKESAGAGGGGGFTVANGGPVVDAAGTVYVTTSAGRFEGLTYTGGSVHQWIPGHRQLVDIYMFPVDDNTGHCMSGSDGCDPEAGVILDQAGNVYGTTYAGGTADCGTVFELSPNGKGGWTETVLYSFQGTADGQGPRSALTLDFAGNLYGTTYYGGNGVGTVFELSPNGSGGWTEAVLYAFQGVPDGADPSSSLVFDAVGNLYGTTGGGGRSGRGTVFELSPVAGGGWTETVLYSFQGSPDGAGPVSSLTLGDAGSLYGTTISGGGGTACTGGCGTVFKLTPNSNGGWNESLLHTFNNRSGGQNPSSGLIFDKKGNLYGTTAKGGIYGKAGGGVMFEITP